jgi:hypothetical protein
MVLAIQTDSTQVIKRLCLLVPSEDSVILFAKDRAVEVEESQSPGWKDLSESK